MKILAPAKLNLALKIGEKQKNGLHCIDSEVIKISLADRLKCTVDSKNMEGKIFLTVTNTTDSDLTILPEENLVLRATKGFFAHFLPGKKIPNIHIELEKNIPIGAGLGGGSSDAAAMIRFLVTTFFPTATTEEILRFGLSLGSDIPFFLTPFARAKMGGCGEKIKGFLPEKKSFFLMVRPHGLTISTAKMFEKWDLSEKKNKKGKNDFEKIVFEQFPEIAEIAEKIEKHTPKVGLSGSGSIVFGVFEKESEAKNTKKQFESKKFWSQIAENRMQKNNEMGENLNSPL